MKKISQRQNQQKESNSTPINNIHKTIQQQTASTRAIFTTHNNQEESRIIRSEIKNNKLKQSNQYQLSTKRQQQSTPTHLKQSKYIKQTELQNQQLLKQKILFLDHFLEQYRLQINSAYSKLSQRQKIYKQTIQKYENQIANLQKQLEGQSKLIQQYLQKYDASVRQHQLCLKVIDQQKIVINDLNMELNTLQRAVKSTRQVSVNLIKQNQDLKAENIIQKQKYQILFQDYEQVSIRFERQFIQLSQQNRILLRKIDEMQTQIKIYEKDKQIQRLLVYQNSIQKRQKQILDQQKLSPLTDGRHFTTSKIHHSYQNEPYSYRPRRLNFEDQTNKNLLHESMAQSNGQRQIIQLQKSKISSLETQMKALQKRNKELQTLMVKCIK